MELYVVRENDKIIALFTNEQRAKFYCRENLANLHYQKEEWSRKGVIDMSEKKGITVRDLASHLLHLIENGDGEKIIKVSVNYDDCEHIQNLTRIGNYKEIDFITLRGGNL